MVVLNILVEGPTEEAFVKNILRQHLKCLNINTKYSLVPTNRSKGIGGGIANYAKVKNEINRLLKERNSQPLILTTMFDLYALPNDFPKFEQASKILDPCLKVKALEFAFAKDINHYRFIPYIQLHEFEALIFTDLEELYKDFPDNDQYKKGIDRLLAECRRYSSPELINQGVTTAPSKRLEKVIPKYKKLKTSLAPQVVEKIGLAKIREKCPHFNQWITRLENLQV
ncbi:DUF4276 family protein [Pseudanabaena sp. UWO311]|uniref:DUF4276 family protein n=1 Tax=Pseudanabaena sp. UWO311 TaxID=2487337 RepID=UPI00115A0D6E|nr:DUF4276 family protein [Pseudanabaena sp. UWO311]TYQ28745.1 DUF4276 family protein [Pseudanabaena sp. UWO311]